MKLQKQTMKLEKLMKLTKVRRCIELIYRVFWLWLIANVENGKFLLRLRYS